MSNPQIPLYNRLYIQYTPQSTEVHYIGYRIQGSGDDYIVDSESATSGNAETYDTFISANTYCGDVIIEYWVVPECGYNPEVIPPTHPSAVFGTVTFDEVIAECSNKVYDFKYIGVEPASENVSIDAINCKGAVANFPSSVNYVTNESSALCIDPEAAAKINLSADYEVTLLEDNPCECSCYDIIKVYNTEPDGAEGEKAKIAYLKYVENFFSPAVSETDQSVLFDVDVPYGVGNAIELKIIPGSYKLVYDHGVVIVDQVGDCNNATLCGVSPALTPIQIPASYCGGPTPPVSVNMTSNELSGYTYTYYTTAKYAIEIPNATVSWAQTSNVEIIAYAILINDTTGCEYRRPIYAEVLAC